MQQYIKSKKSNHSKGHLSNLKFPEKAQQIIGVIFREENEGKALPGAAFVKQRVPTRFLPLTKDKNFSLEKAGAGPARPCKNQRKLWIPKALATLAGQALPAFAGMTSKLPNKRSLHSLCSVEMTKEKPWIPGDSTHELCESIGYQPGMTKMNPGRFGIT